RKQRNSPSPSEDIPLAAELGFSGGLQAHGLYSGSSSGSLASAKQEWLSNTHKLRQRIGERGANRTSGEVKDGLAAPALTPVARKRRSAGCEVRSAMPMRDFLILKSNHKRGPSGKSTASSTHTMARSRQSVANSIASSIRDDQQSVDAAGQKKGSKPPFVQAMAVRRAREAEIAQNSVRSAITSRYYPTGSGMQRRESLDDVGAVLALDEMMGPASDPAASSGNPIAAQQRPAAPGDPNGKPASPYGMTYEARGNSGAHGEQRSSEVSDMLMADFDRFADVTFDAGMLFRQSIVDRAAVGTLAQPSAPSESPAASVTTADRSSGVRGRHSRRDGSGGDSSGHRFFSKVRHAFSSRGNNSHSSQGHYQQQFAEQPYPPVPQLPPQLPPVGGSQPRRLSEAAQASLQTLRGGGEQTPVGQPKQPRTLKTSKSAVNIGKAAAPPRLDFDFGMSLLTPESLRKPSSETGVGTAGAQEQSSTDYGSQTTANSNSPSYLIDYINHGYNDSTSNTSFDFTGSGESYSRQSVARRIINKNTQVRQTQYEYNFGSQIFDCFDNDFMLLKTDAFNNVGGLAASPAVAGSSSISSSRPKQVRKTAKGANPAPAARKKNVDSVTAAAAYTAAAINSLVANGSKTRGPVASAATGSSTYQQHQVLIPSALK
ncbi:hypothetical protein EC988_003634, partial [Linderina pennispora]